VIVFDIVKEPYGWAVRRGDCMMMPAASRADAIEAAERMIRTLGEQAHLGKFQFEKNVEPKKIL
jgi:hypothetical protein